jgi:phage replication O-like protein O
MANPQKENGFTPISNEILEALAKIRINGEAMQILMVVFRKTYGFGKKQDKISLSQFVLSTSLKKSNVCRGLNKLINMNIIIKIDKESISIYQFNKDFDSWKPLSKLITVIQTDNESLSKRRHTKDNIQKKEILANASVPLKEKTLKNFRDARRIESGRPPMTPRTPTKKQESVAKALKWIDDFKQKGYEQHGMQFMKVKDEKRNKAVRQLAIRAISELGEKMNELTDWWFSGNGEWAQYEPENCLSSKTLERFLNKGNKKLKKEWWQ